MFVSPSYTSILHNIVDRDSLGDSIKVIAIQIQCFQIGQVTKLLRHLTSKKIVMEIQANHFCQQADLGRNGPG